MNLSNRVLISRKTSRPTQFQSEQTSSPCNSGGHFRCLKPIDAASQTEWRVLARKSPKCLGKQQGANLPIQRKAPRVRAGRGAQIGVGRNLRQKLLGIDPLFQCSQCGDDLAETRWFFKIHVTHVLIVLPQVGNA